MQTTIKRTKAGSVRQTRKRRMNAMTDRWTVFERDAGQGVTRAYKYDERRDEIMEMVSCHASMTVYHRRAPCPEEVEWNGSEGVAPFDRDSLTWTLTDN